MSHLWTTCGSCSSTSPGLPEIATFAGFEDAEPELVEAILIEAARFAGEVLAPLNETGDRQGVRWTDGKVTTPDGFPAAYRQFIEAGWHGMPASPDIGGQGMPAVVSSAGRRDVEILQPVLLALSDAHHGRGRGARTPRVRRDPAALLAQNGRRRVDWNDEPDRTTGGIGPVHRTDARRTGRRPLSLVRVEDLHHLGRTRCRRKCHPSRAGAIAGRASGNARYFVVRGTQVPGQPRRQPRMRETISFVRPSNTNSASMDRPPRSCPTATRKARSPTSLVSRTVALNTCSP